MVVDREGAFDGLPSAFDGLVKGRIDRWRALRFEACAFAHELIRSKRLGLSEGSPIDGR